MFISNFNGDTFVAFMDISGFKELMKQGKAIEAMSKFYSFGYDLLQEHVNVEALFISDSAVLFVNNEGSLMKEKLKSLLIMVQDMNKRMLGHDCMLTTSIAYGEFVYQNRIEFPRVSKNGVYGVAYVNAFLDNESGIPRIQPEQCRIIVDDNIRECLIECSTENRMLRPAKNDKKHYQFYWNDEDYNNIDEFEKEFNDSYNVKFAGMLKALKERY